MQLQQIVGDDFRRERPLEAPRCRRQNQTERESKGEVHHRVVVD
jgi:hypothetical protein